MGGEKKVYTLYQLNRSIKNALETKAGESGFWVKAEIAKVSKSKPGHVYIDFVEEKDGVRKAAIRGTVWSSAMRAIRSSLGEDTDSVLSIGSEIVFLCKVTFHEVYGLSLSISEIDLSFMLGELERRKKETIEHLKKEGIDMLNKARSLPRVPHKIALVGSPGTSGFRDFSHHILHNEWRFRFDIEVYPTPVQGSEAIPQIINALNTADSNSHDAIVLVRGGGSPLDLDCFNALDLAVAIGECNTPVLTGIGHETDFCVADLVAHKFFKTPTDVGDYIVELASHFASFLIEVATKVGSRSQNIISREHTFLEKSKILIRELPLKLLKEKRTAFDQIKIDLKRDYDRLISSQKDAISNLQNTIKLLHPNNTLARGYGIVSLGKDSIPSVKSLNIGDEIDVQLKDGSFTATVNEIKK